MWDKYSEDRSPGIDVGRIVKLAVFVALGVIIFAIVSNESVNLLMNVGEFGQVYTKPLYFSAISGLILASIALVRANFANRHSITWYGIRTIVNLLKRNEYEQTKMLRYPEFKMSPQSFALWQLMKVLLFGSLFSNLVFGMTIDYMANGGDIGLGSLGSVFGIPFADITTDPSFSQANVLPMVPALTLLLPPLLAAVSLRLLLYVGISGTINVATQYVLDSREGKPRFLSYISTIEMIIGVTVFWLGFNLFFSSGIDYNTRYAIAGTLGLGAAFVGYSFLDRRTSRVMIYPSKRHLYSRLLTIGIVVGLVGSVMAVNHSIADAKKIEWMGPYTAQEIAVNRQMHGLDDINIVNYSITAPSVSPSAIQSVVRDNGDELANVRLWDQAAASSKLKPELGQRNDIHYVDTDLLRFSGTMYWAGMTAPNLPADVSAADRWFAEHITLTNSDPGIKMLEADTGNVVDESKFFSQGRIYYGESDSSGLFDKFWSAYPVGRADLRQPDQYNGTGGIDVSPPLSWMFEPNFMLSYPTTPIHVMRFKDVHDRMETLYPYFVYDFALTSTTNPQFKPIDAYSVTDGRQTYLVVPLVAAFDTSHVPWSSKFMLQLVGFSLVDTYSGKVQVIATGQDFYSKMFLQEYRDTGATDQVYDWLGDQIKYPEEMFIWKVSQFSMYHVTDPKTFIEARQFYSIPEDASESVPPYYIYAAAQGSSDPEFLGFQPLELRNTEPKNIVGYMTVRNSLDSFGEMTFFSVPTNSTVKMLGPTGTKEMLEKNADFKNLRNLLNNNVRIGENILYRIGDYDVYFIPVYTSSSGTGSVAEIGTVAAVGATSATGTYYVGLGNTPSVAFENYLQKISGESPPAGQGPGGNGTGVPERSVRIQTVESMFTRLNVTVARPTAISAHVEFREAQLAYGSESDVNGIEAKVSEFVASYFTAGTGGRVFEWQADKSVNFGVLLSRDGIVENHYISIEVD